MAVNISQVYFKIISDSFLRNSLFIVFAVITSCYHILGWVGSLSITISFLGGIYVFHKLFQVHKCIVPDLTKIFLSNSHSRHPSIDHARRQLVRQNTSDPGCRVCADPNCGRDNSPTHSTKPWEELTIPANINKSLENILVRILDSYVNNWYSSISDEGQFQIELKATIRHAASILIHRIRKANLSEFILYRILPVCTNHLNTSDIYHSNGGTTINWHPALTNRQVELEYLRSLTRQVLPTLLPPSSTNCKIFSLLTREIISGWILLPMSDSACNPAILNTLLFYLLSPSKDVKVSQKETVKSSNKVKKMSDKIPENPIGEDEPLSVKENTRDYSSAEEVEEDSHINEEVIQKDITNSAAEKTTNKDENVSDKDVTFLGNFVPKIEVKRDLWNPSLDTILKNPSLLFSFMQYLKTQSDVNVLQFCLDIGDFNLGMLADLTSDDLDILYKDAWDLYSVYFSPHSPDSIGFDPKLCQDLRKILSKDVSKLRTSPPLFEAYDFAYAKLEKLHVANFHKSEQFFNWLCGPKISSSNTSSGLSSPESLDSPIKRKKSPEGPVAKLSNQLQKITGVLKPNIVLEGQKDVESASEPEIEMAESVKECEEKRDLSRWKVTVFTSKNKAFPHFTVKVVRTDLPADSPESEWSVHRKIADFYALESKLTEFHGSFPDVQLPQKKLLAPCPEDSRIYETYLRTLLCKPALKGSDLLCVFLKARTFEVEQFALGKLFRKPITLKKERGQHLDTFIKNFIESTKTKASKIEWRDISEELKPRHVIDLKSEVFGNNLDRPVTEDEIESVTFHINSSTSFSLFDGPAKCLLFFGAKCFNLSGAMLRMAFMFMTLFRSTIDSLSHIFVTRLLNSMLASNNISYVIYLLEWSLFDNNSVVDPKQVKDSVDENIEQMSTFVRPVYRKIFSTLQHPMLNKQLFYHLLEEVLVEIFPELLQTQLPLSSEMPSQTSNEVNKETLMGPLQL